jgi:hypothetical protein
MTFLVYGLPYATMRWQITFLFDISDMRALRWINHHWCLIGRNLAWTRQCSRSVIGRNITLAQQRRFWITCLNLVESLCQQHVLLMLIMLDFIWLVVLTVVSWPLSIGPQSFGFPKGKWQWSLLYLDLSLLQCNWLLIRLKLCDTSCAWWVSQQKRQRMSIVIMSQFVNAMTRPESTLKKKHNAINYHWCHLAIAAGHIQVAWINGTDNLADALTSKVTVGELRRYLFLRILWWKIYPPHTSLRKFYGDCGYQTGDIPE